MFWAKFALMASWETCVFCVLILSLELIIFTPVAGAGKSILWHVNISAYFFQELNGPPLPSSSIIQDIQGVCASGQASLAFFYCDFREDKKKDGRGLLSSLLVQLCVQSDAYYDALFKFYLEHKSGSQHASIVNWRKVSNMCLNSQIKLQYMSSSMA